MPRNIPAALPGLEELHPRFAGIASWRPATQFLRSGVAAASGCALEAARRRRALARLQAPAMHGRARTNAARLRET
ncbi:MAG: hypothetical protein ACRDQZ_23660 [Mycobacteriales bacterium]